MAKNKMKQNKSYFVPFAAMFLSDATCKESCLSSYASLLVQFVRNGSYAQLMLCRQILVRKQRSLCLLGKYVNHINDFNCPHCINIALQIASFLHESLPPLL